MKTKLSYSQISKYMQCPKSYDFHYNKRLRSNVTSAALSFGSALDAALNILLTDANGKPEEKFVEEFTHSFINGTRTYLPSYPHLVYADADYDEELLPSDVSEARRERYKELRAIKKERGYTGLGESEKVEYNEMNWLSLKAKGLLMLVAYRKKVLPKIEKVHCVQRKVSLENDAGDEIIGYVDLVADVKDVGTVILDNKTSAMEYEEDSVLTSPQLSQYVHMLEAEYNTRKAGYIVLRKNVIKNRKKTCSKCNHDGSGGRAKTCDNVIAGKRCGGEWVEVIDPDIAIQFITDEIPAQTEQIVIENIDDVNQAIKHGHFTRNLNSCNNTYGGPCPYRDLCFKGSEKGLVKV